MASNDLSMGTIYDLFIDNQRVKRRNQERLATVNLYTRDEWASLLQAISPMTNATPSR